MSHFIAVNSARMSHIQNKEIAVILTSHNRKEKTLSCLKDLFSQNLPPGLGLRVFLVDDGSSDGTSAAVRSLYPQVLLIPGDGTLYWGGGMRLAFATAMREDFDEYLWLNDDTELMPGALAALLSHRAHFRASGENCIIVGSCCDPVSGAWTYGGTMWDGAPVWSSEEYSECAMMNGNIALIPRKIAGEIGNISSEFRHTSGDNDYGLRAIAAGFKLRVPPGYYGYCEKGSPAKWADKNVPLPERWRLLHSPKGQPPYETYVFAKRHSGIFWWLDVVKLYLRVLFPDGYGLLKHFFRPWR